MAHFWVTQDKNITMQSFTTEEAVAHIALIFNVMSSRQTPAAAAIAVVATVASAALAALLLQRRGVAKQLEDEEPPMFMMNITTDTNCGQHQRRMTLEELLKDGDLTVKPIGTVRSIYRLCVGTPRQGLLAPNARGRLELDGVSHDAVLELDGFSHVWVIFVFHLNTMSKNNRVPSKIAPPALGGKKVGVLATRSPHRANPIGMTLCKLDSITLPTKGSLKTILNVSGLDLVDGTPILDIKPYVPNYDSVPSDQVHLPPWVSGGLATRRPVHIQPKALEELQVILSEQPNALDFYGTHCGDGSMDETMESITHCIAEVLGIDVRSAWQTNKARDSKFQAERAGRIRDVLSENSAPATDSEQCTQQLDNLLIYYTVQAPEQHARNTSEGSGAEDIVHVNCIQLLTGEKSTSNCVGEVRGAIVTASPVAVYEDEQLKEGIAIEAASSVSVDVEEQPKESTAIDVTSAVTVGPDDPPKETMAISAASSVIVEGDKQPKKPAETDVRPKNELPTDADYKSLKSYWGKAAARNTPTGLVPEEKGRQTMEKFFVFSDKPVTPIRPAAKTGALVHAITDGEMASVDLLSNDETKMAPRGVKSGAPVHPDDANEMPSVVPQLPAAEIAVGDDEVDDKTGVPNNFLPRPSVRPAAKTGALVHAITDAEMASVDLLSNDETKIAPRGVKSGAPVHPDDANEMSSVVPQLPAAEIAVGDNEVDDKTGVPNNFLPRPVVESSEQENTFGDDSVDDKTNVAPVVPLLLPVAETSE